MRNPTDIVPQQPAQPQAAAGQPSRARRRLLLGATGALPTVLTLSSGAQAAVASNLRCLTPPAQQPTRFTPQDDNWVRAQVNVAAYENRPAYCITTPGNSCVDINNQAAPGSRWVVDGNTMTAGLQNNLQVLNERSYGLVYVDRTGSVQTLDTHAGAASLTPVTDSCWTSLLGGRTSSLG